MTVRGRARTERVKGGKKKKNARVGAHGWEREEKARMSKGRFARRNVFCDRMRPPAVAGIIGNVISYIRYARLTERGRITCARGRI